MNLLWFDAIVLIVGVIFFVVVLCADAVMGVAADAIEKWKREQERREARAAREAYDQALANLDEAAPKEGGDL